LFQAIATIGRATKVKPMSAPLERDPRNASSRRCSRQYVGIDLRRRRWAIYAIDAESEKLDCLRIANDPMNVARDGEQGRARRGGVG
jgi:hypothetical protein